MRATSTSSGARLGGAVLLVALAACGSGGDEGPPPSTPTPSPVVLAVDRPLDPTANVSFVVEGRDFPGTLGSPVEIRLSASDGRVLTPCDASTVVLDGALESDSAVRGAMPPFVLTRDVTATVTLVFAQGETAVSAGPIASLVGRKSTELDHDLDGTPDDCDPGTYTFEGDAIGARPADTTPLDGPGQPALVAVDRSGDRAVAFTGNGSPVAYERFDRLGADFPMQDTTVYLDVASDAGSLNLDLGNEGSLGGYAGGSIIFQVLPNDVTSFYERRANEILHAVVGPPLPVGGRLRLRVRHGTGGEGSVHLDALLGATWQDDVFVYAVADMRPYRGLEVAASNYAGGGRGLRRLTVVREIPAAPFTLAKAPGRSADWQVFQRRPDGTASIPLRLLYRLPAGGTAEIRVSRAGTGEVLAGFDFADHVVPLPPRAAGRADVTLPAVPQGGNYDVAVRVRDADGALVGQQALTDVAVGDVYVAAGQSNMSGYSGNLVGAESPTPLAHLFHNDGTWKAAAEPMDDGANQTDWISLETPLSSCLLAFANALSSATGVPVGVVPTSLGGTNLYAQWQRNGPFPAHRGTLYGSMISRARAACPSTPPRGLLWFQGESDAYTSRTSAQYLADLQQLVAGVRADLAAPGLVFLCGQLGTVDHAPEPTWIGVQEAQRSAVALDPLAALATAVDLGRSDAIHFNVAGYRTLGRRFATGARQKVHGHAVDPTNDLASLALAADGTSVALRYERPVSGGAPSLYRAADAGGVLGVSSVSVAGDTVTVAFSRAMGAGGRLAYGFSDVPTDAWVRDAADASAVPCFTGLVVSP